MCLILLWACFSSCNFSSLCAVLDLRRCPAKITATTQWRHFAISPRNYYHRFYSIGIIHCISLSWVNNVLFMPWRVAIGTAVKGGHWNSSSVNWPDEISVPKNYLLYLYMPSIANDRCYLILRPANNKDCLSKSQIPD